MKRFTRYNDKIVMEVEMGISGKTARGLNDFAEGTFGRLVVNVAFKLHHR
jgi:hypothetical protein